MNLKGSREFDRRVRAHGGFALVTAMVVMLLVSAVVVSLIDRSGDEEQSSARSRAFQKNLYAADAGIQLSLQRIQLPRDLTGFSYSLSDGTRVESRTRGDASLQPIGNAGIGAPPEGYSINIGGGIRQRAVSRERHCCQRERRHCRARVQAGVAPA